MKLIKNQKSPTFSLIDKLSINLIFLINILFFASILNINSKYILYSYVILIIFLYFFNFRKFNFKSIKIDYYFLVLLSFIILISIDIAHELYFAWDTQVHWFFKALNFFQDQEFENLNNLPAPDYPHLGPYIWSFFWKFPSNSLNIWVELLMHLFIRYLYFSITECLRVNVYEKIIFAILLIFLTYNYELFFWFTRCLIFSIILIIANFLIIFLKKNLYQIAYN